MKELSPYFQYRKYIFRRKVFKLLGEAFYILNEEGKVLFYGEQKAFKLKEDFRIYSDKQKTKEVLIIKTPQILDISATYNVQDALTKEFVGAIKRKGLKSVFKDEWIFLSKEGQEIGKLTEESIIGAFLSRIGAELMYFNLIPQKYVILTSTGKEVARIVQHFNPFVLKYTMEIKEIPPSIDVRLLIAMGILLAGIEKRQE